MGELQFNDFEMKRWTDLVNNSGPSLLSSQGQSAEAWKMPLWLILLLVVSAVAVVVVAVVVVPVVLVRRRRGNYIIQKTFCLTHWAACRWHYVTPLLICSPAGSGRDGGVEHGGKKENAAPLDSENSPSWSFFFHLLFPLCAKLMCNIFYICIFFNSKLY